MTKEPARTRRALEGRRAVEDIDPSGIMQHPSPRARSDTMCIYREVPTRRFDEIMDLLSVTPAALGLIGLSSSAFWGESCSGPWRENGDQIEPPSAT